MSAAVMLTETPGDDTVKVFEAATINEPAASESESARKAAYPARTVTSSESVMSALARATGD
jgi:hypothetical protein